MASFVIHIFVSSHDVHMLIENKSSLYHAIRRLVLEYVMVSHRSIRQQTTCFLFYFHSAFSVWRNVLVRQNLIHANLCSHIMCIADESSLSEPVSHLNHAASSTSQQSEVLSQPRASRVTWDDEEVRTQLPSQSLQLSPSQSVFSQIAESTQDQAELVSADSDTSISLEADLPNLASAAEEAAESADDDYGNEFEVDEPLVDESPDSSPAEAPSETIYDNPLGSESSESALDMPDQDVSGHVAPTHGATLAAQAAPHETHVTTQLAVSEQGSVKLHYGLEQEDQSSADVQHSLPSDLAAAGHMGHMWSLR